LVAHQRPIQIGEIAGNDYVVKEGLKAGEQVIVSGGQALTDGAAISPQQ
jgi:multidrug efflux pump subunit AcrA (membrane-fusion protein)